MMKHQVGIRSHGDEFKWLAPCDLEIDGSITLGQHKNAVEAEIQALKAENAALAAQIASLRAELQAVKLGNIEIVKELISR